MRRTLKTEAGSTVVLDGEAARISFEFAEEEHACIDCEVDVDMSRATGWKYLMWRCATYEQHDLAHSKLRRFNPNKDPQPV